MAAAAVAFVAGLSVQSVGSRCRLRLSARGSGEGSRRNGSVGVGRDCRCIGPGVRRAGGGRSGAMPSTRRGVDVTRALMRPRNGNRRGVDPAGGEQKLIKKEKKKEKEKKKRRTPEREGERE